MDSLLILLVLQVIIYNSGVSNVNVIRILIYIRSFTCKFGFTISVILEYLRSDKHSSTVKSPFNVSPDLNTGTEKSLNWKELKMR
jgi:hypothetical protein